MPKTRPSAIPESVHRKFLLNKDIQYNLVGLFIRPPSPFQSQLRTFSHKNDNFCAIDYFVIDLGIILESAGVSRKRHFFERETFLLDNVHL